MKTTSKLMLGIAATATCLALSACDDGNTPGKKDVQVKPPNSNPVAAPGDKFKNSFGSNNSGGPAGNATPPAEGEKKE
jgi:hypothetical protein